MKLTIGRKLSFLICIILLIVLILGTTSYLSMKKINNSLSKITESAEPMSVAAFEMEINVLDISFGVLGYLHDRNPLHLERIKNNKEAFKKVHGKFSELTVTKEGKEFSTLIVEGYNKFIPLAYDVIHNKDAQHKKNEVVLNNFNNIGRILNKKSKLGIEMQIKINAIEKGLSHYLNTHQDQYEKQVLEDSKAIETDLGLYEKLKHSLVEKKVTKELRGLVISSTSFVKEIIDLNKEGNKNIALFIERRKELDTLLNDKIQVFTSANLKHTDADAHATTTSSLVTILTLVIACFILAALIGSLTIRSITTPITKLIEAANNISKGNLGTEIQIKSDDELGELATAFNRMRASLKIMMEDPSKD